MVEHEFGGGWTEEKLLALKNYLPAYRQIFTQNDKAKNLKTIYVDAFAGTGDRKISVIGNGDVPPLLALLGEEEEKLDEASTYKKGSARIALELESPFDQYIFVDKKATHIDQLNTMIDEDFPALKSRCRVWKEDGVQILRELCLYRNWKRERAVVFLDPYGMNVEWDLLRQIANTKAIDLWLLFPLGMGVNRLMTRDGEGPSKAFSEKLTRMFGTDEWKDRFYKRRDPGLFDDDPQFVKDAPFELIGEFFLERLKTIFTGVAPRTKALRNSCNNPMYLLCFAAGNPVGASTAIKIADHLLGK